MYHAISMCSVSTCVMYCVSMYDVVSASGMAAVCQYVCHLVCQRVSCSVEYVVIVIIVELPEDLSLSY